MKNVKSDWSFFWFLKALTVASLAFAGTLSTFCAAASVTDYHQPQKLLTDAEVGLSPAPAVVKSKEAGVSQVVGKLVRQGNQGEFAWLETPKREKHQVVTTQIVEVEGMGLHEFPADATPDEIREAINNSVKSGQERDRTATTIDFQPDPQPTQPTATPGAGVDWVSFAMLATLVGGIVLLVLWQLWLFFLPTSGTHTSAATGSIMKFRIVGADARSGKDRTIEVEAASEKEAVAVARAQGVFTHHLKRHFSPASRERLNQSQDSDVYIISNCRLCGGSIEFPEHGLGESVGCPHCNEEIQLRRLDAAERLFLGVRVWCREQSFNWKWGAGVIAVLILCGTALFIYRDYKAEWRKHEEQRAKQEQERTALQRLQLGQLYQANERAAEQASRERDKILYETEHRLSDQTRSLMDKPASEIPFTPAWREKRRQQESLDAIVAEFQRANDHAERVARQSWLDKSLQQVYPPAQYPAQNNDWILRYNAFSGQWQYAPPNAQLKYNAYQNRYEWVP